MELPRGLLKFAREHRKYNNKRDERHHNYIIWMATNAPVSPDKYLMKGYGELGLCPCCGAHVKNWLEVFGEVHKCL